MHMYSSGTHMHTQLCLCKSCAEPWLQPLNSDTHNSTHSDEAHAKSPIGPGSVHHRGVLSGHTRLLPAHPCARICAHTELTEGRVGKWLSPLVFCQCLENLCSGCSVPPNLSFPSYKSLYGAKPLALRVCQNHICEDIGTSKWGMQRTTSD